MKTGARQSVFTATCGPSEDRSLRLFRRSFVCDWTGDIERRFVRCGDRVLAWLRTFWSGAGGQASHLDLPWEKGSDPTIREYQRPNDSTPGTSGIQRNVSGVRWAAHGAARSRARRNGMVSEVMHWSSVFANGGTAIVFHAAPGASGPARIACGVIRRQSQ
jgi:hypothetical protein